MDVSLYHASLDVFCNNISQKEASILEVACGPGNIAKYLLTQRPDFNLLGTDMAPNMLELAKANNPQAKFQIMDCRDMLSLSKKFDGVVCGFGLPYLSKQEVFQFIQDASEILNKQGVLYISTMEGDFSKSGYEKGSSGDEIFIHYYTAEFLVASLKEFGFDLTDLRRKEYAVEGRPTVTDLIIVAEKKNV